MLKANITRTLSIVLLALIQTVTWSQGVQTETKVEKRMDADWYKQPYVWILVGAVFILILVALLRNNGKKSA